MRARFTHPKRRFGKAEPTFPNVFSSKLYPSQTKILEGRTNISEFVFEALFNVMYPKSSTHTLEKCFENAL
jgi:hypothetical protein